MMDLQPTVMIVTAEFWPFAKTGGLGDMVYSIATSLRDHGLSVRVLIPGYRSLSDFIRGAERRDTLQALGHDVDLLVRRWDGFEFVILGCGPLYDRPGNIYMEDFRKPWSDNATRFGVFCRAAAMIANGSTAIDPPDLLHIHDWHAGLTPAYLDAGIDIPVVLTVQNFMFQGRFPKDVIPGLRLPSEDAVAERAELFGGLSFLQAGLNLSDVLTTNSQSYIAEMRLRNRYNWYYLHQRDLARLIAIKNWPERDVWNPASDDVIVVKYDADRIGARIANKRALERRLGWTGEAPILCTLSRITKAKGFKFLLRHVGELLDRGCRLVIVGDGDRPLMNAAANLAQANPGRIALVTPYTEDDARRVLSGADILLMPSLTEPCGLSQQHAQMYGCVPIVSCAGGLPDTVEEGKTGFLFQQSDQQSFLSALDRALGELRGQGWQAIQQQCMRSHDFSPARSAYAELFRDLVRGKAQRIAPALERHLASQA